LSVRRADGRGACLAALALALALAASTAAAQVEVSIPEARAIAVGLEAEGRRQEAAAIAAALLQRDPDDAVAWILVARIRRAAGDIEGALDAARRANASAATDDERYAAAMELAAANFLLEQGLIAQFWLRRAAQVAPTEDLRAAAIRDFRSVRARTPWSYSLSFSVVPSSNVNNGSRADTVEIAGLPFVLSGDAQALSGVEIALSGAARYRFEGLGGQPAQAFAGFALQQVVLSDAARREAPTATGADYAFEAIEVGISQVVSSWSEDVVLRFDALAGRNRYGGAPLSNYARGGLVAQWAPGQQSLATLAASVERQRRLDDPERSAWVSRLDLRRIWQNGDGDVFGLGGGVRLVQSDSIEIDNDAVLFETDYTFAEPVIGPATLGVGLNVERRVYDASPFTTDGRQDTRVALRATLGAPSWNVYGFGPTLTIEASRTLSNVSLYEADDIGIRLGVTSVF
jgi:tetratricopeptide (TPR) repeat protein